MTDYFVNLPQIFCSRHPQYQLNMVCRLDSCPLKGALCCRCQLKLHSGNGHTFESFVPLDEVIVMAQSIDDISQYEDDLSQQIVANKSDTYCIQEQFHQIYITLIHQLRSEYQILGGFQQHYKDFISLIQNLNQKSLIFEETPTDDGEQANIKDVFLDLMSKIAHKIQIKQGEFYLDKSELLQYQDKLFKRKSKVLQQLRECYQQTISQSKMLHQMLNSGCAFGIDQNLHLHQFKEWHIAYKQPYSHKTTYEELISLDIPSTAILCVGALRDQEILLCAIDKISIKDINQCQSNGIYWYCSKDQSFGFADNQDFPKEGVDQYVGEQRLCWSLNGDGGYRCGDYIEQQNQEDIWKIILYLDNQ